MSSELETGKVKWFSDKKGYGFISRSNGKDLFVHYSDIQSDGFKTLKADDEVSFEVVTTDKGEAAANVSKV